VLGEVASGLCNRIGAVEILKANWLRPVRVEEFRQSECAFGLGIGEISAIQLAKQLNADLILLDDMRARRRAILEGLTPMGCVGLLKAAFLKGLLSDLRKGYAELAAAGAWIDLKIVNRELSQLGLEPLQK